MVLHANEIEVGDTFSAVVVENLKRTQIVQYAGASGDYNPLHTDEVFATQVQRPGVPRRRPHHHRHGRSGA